MKLVTKLYTKTNSFPKEEIYGLTLQIKRSAIAIPCNTSKNM
ncbi:MAG: four helix bundle protein [Bacteroidota bacterium]